MCKMSACGPGPHHNQQGGGPLGPPCAFAHPMSPISENSTASSVQNSEATTNSVQGHSAPHHQQESQQQGGFNSNCQQCLAERAAAEARVFPTSSGTLGSSSETNNANKPQSESGGIEFASLPSPEVSLEETRPRRSSMSAAAATEPPARTYECEVWCRQTSRTLAGCLGVCCLAAGYAAIGGLLFMAVETRAAEGRSEAVMSMPDAVVGSAAAVTVSNATTMLSEESRAEVEKARAQTVERLWLVTERMNILYPENWTRRAAEEIVWFQDQLVKAYDRQFSELRSQASKQLDLDGRRDLAAATEHPLTAVPREWTFARGLLYAVSLLTTVGEWEKGKVFVAAF